MLTAALVISIAGNLLLLAAVRALWVDRYRLIASYTKKIDLYEYLYDRFKDVARHLAKVKGRLEAKLDVDSRFRVAAQERMENYLRKIDENAAEIIRRVEAIAAVSPWGVDEMESDGE